MFSELNIDDRLGDARPVLLPRPWRGGEGGGGQGGWGEDLNLLKTWHGKLWNFLSSIRWPQASSKTSRHLPLRRIGAEINRFFHKHWMWVLLKSLYVQIIALLPLFQGSCFRLGKWSSGWWRWWRPYWFVSQRIRISWKRAINVLCTYSYGTENWIILSSN